MPKPDDMLFVVTVPHDVQELFVDVRQPPDDHVVWQVWCDYYLASGIVVTGEEARSLMARHTEEIVERLLAWPVRLAEYRTSVFRRRRLRAEWWTGDDWQEVTADVF